MFWLGAAALAPNQRQVNRSRGHSLIPTLDSILTWSHPGRDIGNSIQKSELRDPWRAAAVRNRAQVEVRNHLRGGARLKLLE